MTSSLVTIEELTDLEPPAPARPRVLLIGTVFASAATVLGFGGLIALYLHQRADAIASDGAWLPEGTSIPLTPPNMMLVGFTLSLVFMHMAIDTIGRDDRRHTWLAFGSVLIVGAFYFVGTGFLYTQMGFDIATAQGAFVYTVTGAHLAITGAGLLFTGLMAFRTLGGQYSAKDREGVVAATVFWWAVAVTYFALWYAIYVTK